MLRLLRIFFQFKGANPWMVLLCLVAASAAQAFGVASLVPLISIVSEGGPGETSSFAGRVVVETLATLGLPPDLGVLLAIVVIAVLLKAGLTIMAMVYVAHAVADVANGLRQRLIDALLRVRWSYFTAKPSGIVVNAVGMESTMSGMLYLMISRLLTTVIQATAYVAVAFAVSWELALVSLGIGGAIMLCLSFLVRMARDAGKRQIKRSRELLTRLSDALVGIKPLKAMAREDEFGRLFHDKIDAIRLATRREMVSKSVLNNLQEPLLTIMLAVGFFLLIEEFGMPVANVIVMGVLLQRTVNAIGKLQMQYQEAVASEAAYWSVHGILEEANGAREPRIGTERTEFRHLCCFEAVSFSYGRAPILRDFDLEIAARRITLLVGASGVGKTTITDLLLGFYTPESGRIVVDGTPLDRLDLFAWRRSVGYVPQELFLLHDTILANITLGDAALSAADADRALDLAGAREFVDQLPDGVMTEVGEKGSKLSGGQRQRIAIARALVHRPRLLILDEVTSALDSETEREICENIRRIAREVTVLAISHRQAWIDIADRVVTLEPPSPEPTVAADASP